MKAPARAARSRPQPGVVVPAGRAGVLPSWLASVWLAGRRSGVYKVGRSAGRRSARWFVRCSR